MTYQPRERTQILNAPDDLVGVVWVELLPGDRWQVTYREALSGEGEPLVPIPWSTLAHALHELADMIDQRSRR